MADVLVVDGRPDENLQSLANVHIVITVAVLAALSGCVSDTSRAPSNVAQARVDTISTVSCPKCTIRLERVVALGDHDGPGAITFAGPVGRDSRGRFYVPHKGGEIPVFGADGKYVATFGRTGRGPGEYRFVLGFEIDKDDGIHIFDAGNLRYTALSSTWDVVDTRRLPLRFARALHLAGGTIILNANSGHADRIGFPLHLVGPDGAIARSFGVDNPAMRPRPDMRRVLNYRATATSAAGRFWSARINEYTLEQWDTTGSKTRTLVRRPDWFKPWYTHDEFAFRPDRPAAPNVHQIHEDRAGRLWVLIHRSDDAWRDAVSFHPGADGRQVGDFQDNRRAYDTVIEVIDTQTGEVIVVARVDPVLNGFLDDHHVWSYHEDAEGVPRVTVWKLRVLGDTGNRLTSYRQGKQP